MHSTWAVILVHGVGDTDTGATLGALLPQFLKGRPSLVENAPPQLRLLVEPQARLPRPGDTQPPPPSAETSKDPASRFPMYLRTFSNSSANQPDRVALAEVFWADLSRAGASRLSMLVRAISLVFDLRHVSNIAAAYPGLAWAGRLRLILYWVSWLLSGPIAGLTAFMLFLLLARYTAVAAASAAKFSPSPALREIAVAAFGFLVALVISVWKREARVAEDETWRLFATWIQVGGAIAVIVALCRLALGPSFPWGTELGQMLASRLLLGESLAPNPGTTVTHVAVILWLSYLFFSVLALATLLAFAAWVVARMEARRRGEKAAAPALDAALGASLLQVMLWVLIGTLLGALVLYRFLPGYGNVLRTVLTGLTLKGLVATLIVLCAAGVWGWRRARMKDVLAGKSELPRLLVHPLIMGALIGLTLLSTLLFAEAFLTGNPRLHEGLEPYTRYVKWVVLGAVFVPAFFWKGVASALHIVLDVTGHFHRARLDPGKTKIDPQDFLIQQRIEARCRRVLQEVLQPGDVTHLTVIAHSQGTMVALDVLWLEWANNLLRGKTVYLVTLGSPFSHLYQHYFPHRYPPLFTNGQLNGAWGRHLNLTVREWINLHRADDFVGTRVDGHGKFPVNCPHLGAGGHTGYWKDPDALRLIAPYLPG